MKEIRIPYENVVWFDCTMSILCECGSEVYLDNQDETSVCPKCQRLYYLMAYPVERIEEEEKMRDKKRIKRILNLIEIIWNFFPDLRLGQLLYNYGGFCDCHYNTEDDVIEEKLQGILDEISKMARRV